VLFRSHDARSTGRAQAVVREGRHGDARECAGVERRRERPGGDVARVRQGAWAHAPRARHRLRHGRWGAEGPLLRAYRRGPKLDGEGEDADLGLRPDRGQRSVRGPGARRRARPGVGLGPRERKRGRDRVRPPDRRLRRARAHDLAVRPQGPAPDDRTRHPLLGRRQRSGPQRGDALMPVSSAVLAAQPLTLRRAGAIILGAALVAVAAQVSIPLPGTPVPLTLQPLAVLLVGGLLGPALGAASMILYLALGAAGLPVFTPYGLPGLARLIGPTGGYLLAYPVAGVAGCALVGFGGSLLRLRFIRVAEPSPWSLAVNALSLGLSFGFATWLVGVRLAKRSWDQLGWHTTDGMTHRLVNGATLGAVMAALAIALAFLGSGARVQLTPDWSRWAAQAAPLGCALILAALWEELTFRGLPLRLLADALGPVAAMLVLALGFGIAHARNPHAGFLSTVN